MHLRLDLRSFLPSFVVVKSADSHDSQEARTVCAGVNSGETCVFDKAYVDFKHLYELLVRGVFRVTRAKTNMKYEVMGQHSVPKGDILRDEVIRLIGVRTSKWYPKELRLIEAMVEVDGKMKKMTFISNNLEWAASSICDLYKARSQKPGPTCDHAILAAAQMSNRALRRLQPRQTIRKSFLPRL